MILAKYLISVTATLKTASKKVAHKAAEFLGNKIADAVTKSNGNKIMKSDENPRNVEETVIPLELKDSTVSKFVTKKWIAVNDLSNGHYSVNKNISFN